MPASVHHFLTHYLSYIRLNSKQLHTTLHSMYLENVTDNSNIVDEYSTLTLMTDYSHPLEINLAGILCLVCLTLAVLILIILAACISCIFGRKSLGCGHRLRYAAWISNFGMRLGYEFFFEICLCYLIQLSQTN